MLGHPYTTPLNVLPFITFTPHKYIRSRRLNCSCILVLAHVGSKEQNYLIIFNFDLFSSCVYEHRPATDTG